jgi:hypothetical protein
MIPFPWVDNATGTMASQLLLTRKSEKKVTLFLLRYIYLVIPPKNNTGGFLFAVET